MCKKWRSILEYNLPNETAVLVWDGVFQTVADCITTYDRNTGLINKKVGTFIILMDIMKMAKFIT